MIDHPVEQAIRRSHCSHEDRDSPQHQCIGTCLITPQGMILDCKACGGDNRPIAPSDLSPETKLVRIVLDAIGIEYAAITPEYKARAAAAAKRWLTELSKRYG
jgi:hypothetical protein